MRAMANERSLRLAQALEQLPEDQRRVVEMRHFQGCSWDAIAQALGRNKGAAMQLHYRALQGLRGLLTEDAEE